MNILWLSHLVPYPPKGGVLQRSFNLLNEVAKYHKVHLLAFNQRGLLPTDDQVIDSTRALSQICRVIDVLTIPSDDVPYGRQLLYAKSLFIPTPFTVNWLWSRKMEQLLRESLRRLSIDIIHFDTVGLAPYLSAATNHITVLNHHNIESDMMLRRATVERNPLNKLYIYQEAWKLRAYEKQACPRFDLNITCSSLDQHRLVKNVSSTKVAVIPNGVDLEYFHPLNLGEEENTLVFAGGLTWYPNRDAMKFFAEKVWTLLKQAIPAVKMTVVGRSPPSQLLRLADTDSNFRVTGFVPDVRPYLDRASVYVCPIRDGGGTKLKILDALAMGKAIVANPVACEGIDVVNDESVLFATRPEEYVECILRLFRDKILRQRLGQNGRSLVVRKYSFADIGKELANTYSRLLRREYSQQLPSETTSA